MKLFLKCAFNTITFNFIKKLLKTQTKNTKEYLFNSTFIEILALFLFFNKLEEIKI
jgi:hypothetical protein